MDKLRTVAIASALICLAGVPAYGTLISFSGQFHPSLATVSVGGNGWFDPTGAPVSVTLWGSDSYQIRPFTTLVTWNVISPVTDLLFFWRYSTADWSPYWDPAGYYLNGSFVQLTVGHGPNVQGGLVTVASLSAGDVFGFYVTTVDDIEGAASLTISGVPEPGTFVLIGLGSLGLLLGRRLKASRN